MTLEPHARFGTLPDRVVLKTDKGPAMFRSTSPGRIAAASASAVFAVCILAGTASVASAAAGNEATPPRQSWSFSGPFGTFDRAQLQRGFKVYKEVCSNCHGLTYLSFRNMSEKGGPEFSAAQIKELASTHKVMDGPNDKGETYERPGRPSDKMPSPFPNPEAAKATLNAVPPDLSLIAKARGYSRGVLLSILDSVTQYQEQGPDYVAALLNGYTDAPKGVKVEDGLHYNTYFPGNKLSMAKPLNADQVEYTDGTKGTVEQYSRDVTAFLMWTAEPKLEDRKRTGTFFMLLMLVLAGSVYLTKKKIWSAIAH